MPKMCAKCIISNIDSQFKSRNQLTKHGFNSLSKKERKRKKEKEGEKKRV